MTLPKNLKTLCSLVGLLMACAPNVFAQVSLENTISKLQTWVDEDGVVQRRLVDASKVVPGDELQYTVKFVNTGTETIDAGTIVITDAIPEHTQYIDGSARGSGSAIHYSLDGTTFADAQALTKLLDGEEVIADAKEYSAIQWRFAPSLAPGESGQVSFKVRLL